MIDRNIFTETKPTWTERLLDLSLAIIIGLALCAFILHGLDALFF